ncbi:MFS transporter [Sinomonas sp. JGH33]|uniref:MFS transporter n=1 Tax=Sinomonas terricola TaxID=3110330 RepID=A0ABU5T0Y0_9MICC|nr:MFS transporter [Sinomonas sp. JGH33]MEA5453328.1 MFS transporter [Sinomonas sp. JGH33]
MSIFAELSMRPAIERPTTPRTGGWDASRAARLALSAGTLFVLLVGANLATPLYPMLSERLGFGSLGVSVAFASYVLCLIAVLVVAGHWSDHIGRRAALVVAVVLGLAGVAVCATAGSLAELCCGRALHGAAVGLATGASSAAVRELLPDRPAWASRATLLATSGGVALGPVAGGSLALGPASLAVPFAAYAAVLAVLLCPLVLVRARPALRPAVEVSRARLLAPRGLAFGAQSARGPFWRAAGVGFLSFAVFGYFLSLAPGYFARTLGLTSLPAVGALAGLALAAAAAVQLAGRATAARRHAPGESPIVVVGLVLLGVGTLAAGLGTSAGNAVVLVGGILAAGAGQGLAFRELFDGLVAAVSPEQHAQAVSALYVVTYLGSAVPVIGVGALAAAVGLATASTIFTGLCCAAALGLAVLRTRGLAVLRVRAGQDARAEN